MNLTSTITRSKKMKKIGIVLLTLAAMTLASQTCYSAETANTDQNSPKVKKRAYAQAQQGQKQGQDRMQQINQRHQQLLEQLKQIRETAKSENAEKTVAQLDTLIGQMEERAQQMEKMRQERETQRGEGRGKKPKEDNSASDANQ